LSLVPGSDLDLTSIGIATIRSGTLIAFKMRLRSVDDARILRGAWAWSLKYVWWLLEAVTAIAVLLVAWNVALGRKVRAQTGALRRAKDAAEASWLSRSTRRSPAMLRPRSRPEWEALGRRGIESAE
jgi:hypothetical protein